MIHILTSSGSVVKVSTRAQSVRTGDPAVVASLARIMKPKFSDGVFAEQQSYLTTAAYAAFAALNKIDQRKRYRTSVTLTDESSMGLNFIQGSTSSGLGFALALFESFWSGSLGKGTAFEDPIFTTGEINNQGLISPVSYIDEKLLGVIEYCQSKQLGSFKVCLPVQNYHQLSEAQIQLVTDAGGQFISVAKLPEVLLLLLGECYDGDPLGRWEPFKSLRSFEYEDSLRFFGRDKDISRLSDELEHNQGLLIVSGPSGSGKSSLIKAGLIPRLAQLNENLYWRTLTPSTLEESVLSSIVRTVVERVVPNEIDEWLTEILSDLKSGESYRARKLADELSEQGIKFLFHIDQFEEFFTQTFLDEYLIDLQYVQGLVKALPQLKIVLSLRSEYVNNLLNLGKISSPKISNFSERLTIDAWQEIVVEQAEFSGVTFEKTPNDLAARIIDDAFSVDNALPMVEFVLSRLYECAEQRDRDKTLLTYEDYEKLGGITGAIAQRAEDVVEETGATDQDLHNLFCLAVGVTTEGIPYAREFNLETSDTENSVLRSLVDSSLGKNILVCPERGDGSKIKIAHESLFQHWSRLKTWLVEQQAFLGWINSVERNYQHSLTAQDKTEILLTDDALLSEGLDYLKAGILTDKHLADYLLRSSKFKKIKFFRSVVISLIIPLIAVLSFWWYENRSVIEYHTAVAEIYSVPKGIHEIAIDRLDNPDSFYKLEYKGGELTSISYVNNNGYEIPFPNNKHVTRKSYFYDSYGLLEKIVLFDRRGIKFSEKRIVFSDDMSQSMEETSRSMGIPVVPSFNASPLLDGFSFSSSVAKVLRQYNEDGYVISEKALNHYSKPTLFSASHHQVNYQRNSSGLVSSEYYSDFANNPVADEKGIYGFTKIYDKNFNLVKKIIKYTHSSIVSEYRYDNAGNLVTTQILNDDEKISYGSIETRQTTENLYVQELSYPFSIIDFPAVDFIKIIKGVDVYGRLTEISFLDQSDKPVPLNMKKNNLPEELSDIAKFVGFPTYKFRISYSDKNFIKEVGFETQSGDTVTVFIEYDLDGGEIISLRSDDHFNFLKIKSPITEQVENIPIREIEISRMRDSSNNKVSINTIFRSDNNFECVIKQVQNFVGELTSEDFKCNGEPVLNINNYHRVDVVYDDLSRPTNLSFFDIDGFPTISEGKGFGFHEIRLSYDSYGRMNEQSFWNSDGKPMDSIEFGYHRYLAQYSDSSLQNQESRFSAKGQQLYFTISDGLPAYSPLNDPVVINDDIALNTIPSGALVVDAESLIIGVTPIRQYDLKGFDLSSIKLTKLGYVSQTLDNLDINEHNYISLEPEKYPIDSQDVDENQNIEFKKIYDRVLSADTLHDKKVVALDLVPLVELGHVSATALLAELYLALLDDNPTEVNRSNALKFLQLAASRGSPGNLRLLGAEVINPTRGLDIGLSTYDAWRLVAMASDRGNVQASLNMAYGYYYEDLNFPTIDKSLATDYFLRACLAGSSDGCFSYSMKIDRPSDRLKFRLIADQLDGQTGDIFLSEVYSTCQTSQVYFGVSCDYKLAKVYAERAWSEAPTIKSALRIAAVESSLGNFESSREWISKARSLDAAGFDSSSYSDFYDGQVLSPDASITLQRSYELMLDALEVGIATDNEPGLGLNDQKTAIDQYRRELRQVLNFR